jgi:hypothetical protein
MSRKEFTDRVFSFFTHAAGLVVKFHGREANYFVPHEREDFVAQVALLASLWRCQSRVRVVVEPTLEIVSLLVIEEAAAG